jgi:c-di-GMP-binding flagellar brake protein YcgR
MMGDGGVPRIVRRRNPGQQMAESKEDILSQAIERNLAAVLSLPSAGMFRHYKTRFLTRCDDGVWIEGVSKEHLLVDSLIENGHPTGISFRSGTQKVSFAVPILNRDPLHAVNGTTVVEALLIKSPMDVKAIQRRTHYRAPVYEADQITVRLWRLGEQDAFETQPPTTAEVRVTVHNLSIGGLGIILSEPETGPKMVVGQKVRMILSLPGSEKITVDGRCGNPRANANGRMEVGVQFIGLQDRHEGRQILGDLTKLVGILQREEVKRMRRSA